MPTGTNTVPQGWPVDVMIKGSPGQSLHARLEELLGRPIAMNEKMVDVKLELVRKCPSETMLSCRPNFGTGIVG